MSSRSLVTTGEPSSTGILKPVYLTHRPHPFRIDREQYELTPGFTIYEVLEIAQPDPALRACMAVRLQGHDLAPHLWRHVRPKPGMLIEAVPLPQGQDTLRTVLIIAVVAAAMATGAWIFGPAGFGLTGAGFTFGSSILGGALTLGGMLLINALIPPAKPQIDQGAGSISQTYNIEGASNRPRLNAPVPVVLGRHRLVPDLAAPWATYLDGEDEYLYGILCFGVGPASIEDVRIGDSPLSSFQGVETFTYSGDGATSPTFELYPNQVTTLPLGVLLLQGQRQSRLTDTDTDYVVAEFQYREGAITASKSTGDELGVDVNLRYRWRVVGSPTWSAELDWPTSGKQPGPKRLARRINFPNRGQYEVEVRRTTADSDPNGLKRDKVWWENLKSFNYDPPIVNSADLVLMAIKVRATDQLNGVIRDLSAIVTSFGLGWNGPAGIWEYRAIRNPAELFRRFLQGRSLKKPVADDRLDLLQIQHWANVCAANGFTCDFVVDRDMSVLEVLSIVAGCGEASPARPQGLWTVVIDEAKTIPAQLLSGRTVRNFKGRRIYSDQPHALRITFQDITDDYRQQTRLVFADGFSEANATLIEESEFPGVTHPDLIWRFGRKRMAEGIHRSETFQWEMDFEHLVCTRGDLVLMQHDAPKWGRASGRIKSVTAPQGSIVAFVLDEKVVFDGIGDFIIRIRMSDNNQVVYDINQPIGETDTVTTVAPIHPPFFVAPGDHYVIGVRGTEVQELLVKSIEPTGELGARVSAIPYGPEVFGAHLGPIPPWNPNITSVAGTKVPIVRYVVSGEGAATRNADGTIMIRVVVILWDDGSRPMSLIRAIDVAWKRDDDTSPHAFVTVPPDAVDAVILGAANRTRIRIKARYQLLSGGYGPWSSDIFHDVQGPSIPPFDVTTLVMDYEFVTWAFVPGPDHDGFLIRWSARETATWEDAEGIDDTLIVEFRFPSALLPSNAKLVLVKAVTKEGLESVNAARLLVTDASATERVLLRTHSFTALGYPGTVENGEIVGSEVRGFDSSLFLDPPAGLWLEDGDADWLRESWEELTYTGSLRVDQAFFRTTDRLFLRWEAQGEILIYYRWTTNDSVLYGPDEPIPDDFLLADAALPIGVLEGASKVFRPWRQGVPVIPGGFLEVRVTLQTNANNDAPILKVLDLRFDGREIIETFGSLAVPAIGTFRVPVQKEYRVISYVHGLVHAGGVGKFIILDDRSLAGPAIHIEAANGIAVPGIADVSVGGA